MMVYVQNLTEHMSITHKAKLPLMTNCISSCYHLHKSTQCSKDINQHKPFRRQEILSTHSVTVQED